VSAGPGAVANLSQQFTPVHARHPDVCHEQVRLAPLELSQRFMSVPSDPRGRSCILQ
jgi:hypothetical protein